MNGTKRFEVISIKYGWENHTELKLRPIDGFSYRPGQYAFVNIPQLSKFQWHSFSISSIPSHPYISFHMKDMAKHSWTHRLGALSMGQVGSQLVVNVDGPYGYPPSYLDYEVLILVAGGIGITPVHSILMDLYQRHIMDTKNTMKLRKIYFYWCVRKTETIDMLYDSMKTIIDNTLGDKFITKLFVTQPDKEKSEVVDDEGKDKLPLDSEDKEKKNIVKVINRRIPFKNGRPNIDKEFSEIATTHTSSINRHAVLAFVCGPENLVDSVALETYKRNIIYHSETFEL